MAEKISKGEGVNEDNIMRAIYVNKKLWDEALKLAKHYGVSLNRIINGFLAFFVVDTGTNKSKFFALWRNLQKNETIFKEKYLLGETSIEKIDTFSNEEL